MNWELGFKRVASVFLGLIWLFVMGLALFEGAAKFGEMLVYMLVFSLLYWLAYRVLVWMVRGFIKGEESKKL